MFPIHNMCGWTQWVIYLIPLLYFVVIIRGRFLRDDRFSGGRRPLHWLSALISDA